jgi:hypothetical protein
MASSDAERQELARAVALLGGSTRHARLLDYLGTQYFERKGSPPSEFDIATEVFGRSLQTFDPAEDAVVRVEIHRLRKKLRDIYEADRSPHGVRISLPAGTYVLQFDVEPVPRPAAVEPVAAPVTDHAAPSGDVNPAAAAPHPARTERPRIPTWVFYGLAVAAIVTLALGYVLMRGSVESSPETPAQSPRPPAAAAEKAPAGSAPRASSELHLLAGYDGSEVIDNSGVRWMPDRYFVGGGQWSRDLGFIRGTSRPFLYAHWRTGEFGYQIPLTPGSYELRLFFVSPNSAGDEKLAGINVSLNGRPLLEGYDVAMSANGADVADELVFRDVSPDSDGLLKLGFANLMGTPMLNALEVVPGVPGKLRPIRILAQPTSFVDHKGQHWRADDYFHGGFRSNTSRKVGGTEDPELFGAERFGRFRYAIPVDRRGRYTVVLHFAEFYYGPQLPGGGGPGSRLFHVYCNGQTLLRNFDIFKEAGSLRVIAKTFSHVEPSAQGKINLDFEPVVNNATISGIEILEEST